MKIIDAVFDLLFPPRCAVCGAYGREVFCQKCADKIKYAGGAADLPSPDMSIDLMRSSVLYEGPIKEAIHRLKFQNKKALFDPLSELLSIYLDKNRREFRDAHLVMPVPLFKAREEERGYNQSAIFAGVAAEYLCIPLVDNVLIRVKNTRPQFELKRPDRFINVSGAFRVMNNEAVKGRTVLLVDDILTTGATASECAKTLKDAGAKKVLVLTLSRAIED